MFKERIRRDCFPIVILAYHLLWTISLAHTLVLMWVSRSGFSRHWLSVLCASSSWLCFVNPQLWGAGGRWEQGREGSQHHKTVMTSSICHLWFWTNHFTSRRFYFFNYFVGQINESFLKFCSQRPFWETDE